MNLSRENISRKFIVIVSILIGISVVVFLFHTEILTDSLSPIDEKVKQSIVQIKTSTVNNQRYGTGFFVALDLIATNIHVVAVPGQIIARKTINNISPELNYSRSIFYVIGVTAYDFENDLVILQVDGNSKYLHLADSNEVKENQRIASIGFPHRKFKLSKGYVFSKRENDHWLRIAIKIGCGGSGSPIYNNHGKVVGIHNYANNSLGYSFAVPSNALRVLLAQSNIAEPLSEWRKRNEIRSYAFHIKGRTLFDKGRYNEAINEFNHALDLNNKAIYTYYKRGAAKIKLGEFAAKGDNIRDANRYYRTSIEDFTQAILLNPMNAEAFTQRAHAKYELGDKTAALLDYESSIRINSKHEEVFFKHGVAKAILGDHDFEQGDIDKAVRLYNDANYYLSLAGERNPKSRQINRKLKEVNKSLKKCKNIHTVAPVRRKHYQRLISDDSKEMKIMPDYMPPYVRRGNTYFAYGTFEVEHGNISKAQKLYANALSDYRYVIDHKRKHNYYTVSNVVEAYNGLGNVKIELGKIETKKGNTKKSKDYYMKAIQEFDSVMKLYRPEFSDRGYKVADMFAVTYFKRGIAKMALGRKEEAKSDFDKARELNSEFGK